MKNKLLFFAALILIAPAVLNSCASKLVDPEILPGTRDYQWRSDSINIIFNRIYNIWGSSPDDIWGIGPGGSLTTTIWHYTDGKWKTDGKGRDIAPNCIYGFSKDNIWIAGNDGKIWHYNGTEWTHNYQHTINGVTDISIYDLYGSSANDLYAVGTVWFDNETRRGIILHYNGRNWNQLFLAKTNSYFAKVCTDYFGNCIILGIKQDIKYNSRDTIEVYRFKLDTLASLYSDENIQNKGAWIETINGEVVLSLSDGIYKYLNNKVESIYKYNFPRTPGCLIGRNIKDIFINNNGISHFNGSDIQLLCDLGTGWFIDGLSFENDIILLVFNPRSPSTYIYCGKKMK